MWVIGHRYCLVQGLREGTNFFIKYMHICTCKLVFKYMLCTYIKLCFSHNYMNMILISFNADSAVLCCLSMREFWVSQWVWFISSVTLHRQIVYNEVLFPWFLLKKKKHTQLLGPGISASLLMIYFFSYPI